MTASRLPSGASAYLLIGITVALGTALAPTLAGPVAALVPLAGAVAIGGGLLRYRPRVRSPWLLLGGASLLTLANAGYEAFIGTGEPFPSAADALHLAGYAFLTLGVLALAKPVPGRPIWEGTIDAGVVTAGAVVASWTLVIDPLLRLPGLDGHELAGVLTYTILDLVVLTVTARTLFLVGVRSIAALLVMLGVAVLLTSTTAHFVGLARGDTGLDTWVRAGLLIANVLVAAGALHPSMAQVQRLPQSDGPVVSRARLRMYMLLTFLIPVLTIGRALVHSPAGLPADRLVVPLLASAAMSALLLLRVSQLAAVAQRRATELDERTVALGDALHEQEVLQDELRHRVLHDPLTALGNRSLLNERLGHALKRVAPGRLHGLFLLDLDGFKHVNDTLGHPVGDELLVTVADRLRCSVPAGATLVRLGGDEFAVVLVNSSMWELRATAEAILRATRAPYRLAGEVRVLTTSIGVRVIGAPMRAVDVLRDADLALYEAKAAGKNQIRVYADSSAAVDQMAW